MQATALIRPGDVDQWDQALYAFRCEKERRNGGAATVGLESGSSVSIVDAVESIRPRQAQ
jgi:hypothetical protein